MKPQTSTFDDDGAIPNSPLPVLLYRGAVEDASNPAAYEELFGRHGWLGAWRDGIYPFHHFHSTAHEVLGIAGGTARVMLGGPQGDPAERDEVLANIAGVPLPRQDPVAGEDGPLIDLWGAVR